MITEGSHWVTLKGNWRLWRSICLRATGFPARLVCALADEELGARADAAVSIDSELALARKHAIRTLQHTVTRGGDEAHAAERTLKQLARGDVPASITELASVQARLEVAKRAFADRHARARTASSQALREIARDERYRQALLWQNPAVVHTGVDWLLGRSVDATDSATREKERLVAGYLQRFCLKNVTIGFFGPVGWARFSDVGHAVTLRPGASLLARRTVYYEHWAIDALARTWSELPGIRPYIAPRLLPHIRVEGATVHVPIERSIPIAEELAFVASRCDGARTAQQIADELGADAFDALDELAAAGLIAWRLEVPTAGAHPERQLAKLLEPIADRDLRAHCQHELELLERERANVAASSSAVDLEAALGRFDETFSRLTGTSSDRAPGQTYAARRPLFEDCVRDLDLELGRPAIDRFAAPLVLVLQSARWFTYEVARRYRKALAELYLRLATEQQSEVLDFARFWQHVPAMFPGHKTSGSIVDAVRAELHDRWAHIIQIAADAQRIERDASALASEVAEAFAAPGPGWPAARHHSPDLLLAAADTAAIERGDYGVVLGEIHIGINTQVGPLFLKEHADPIELIAAHEADLDRVSIAPVWSKAVTRADYISPSRVDLELETGEARSARPRSQVIAISDLLVERRDGFLEICTRDRSQRFDVIAFLERHLVAETFAAFSLLRLAERLPRVTIDALVVSRASWRAATAEIRWPALKDPVERFLGARAWARSIALPRHVFVKSENEPKPVYVDVASPVYVEILAKLLRTTPSATLSEMLPAIDQMWVVDAQGERYGSELRATTIDPEPWRPERTF